MKKAPLPVFALLLSAWIGAPACVSMGTQSDVVRRCEQIWTVSAVEVRPGMFNFARRYYEAGWLPARREALRRGVIQDYRLLVEREANFQAIFQSLPITRPITIDGRGREEIFVSSAGLEDYGEGFGLEHCVATVGASQ
jgi:hypothetical protein